jgi:hypothetical protein
LDIHASNFSAATDCGALMSFSTSKPKSSERSVTSRAATSFSGNRSGSIPESGENSELAISIARFIVSRCLTFEP